MRSVLILGRATFAFIGPRLTVLGGFKCRNGRGAPLLTLALCCCGSSLLSHKALKNKEIFNNFTTDRYFNSSFSKTTPGEETPPPPVQGHSSFQSMGFLPDFCSSSLALEKCLHPKNPLYTDSGEGCAVCSTWCRFLSMALPFF